MPAGRREGLPGRSGALSSGGCTQLWTAHDFVGNHSESNSLKGNVKSPEGQNSTVGRIRNASTGFPSVFRRLSTAHAGADNRLGCFSAFGQAKREVVKRSRSTKQLMPFLRRCSVRCGLVVEVETLMNAACPVVVKRSKQCSLSRSTLPSFVMSRIANISVTTSENASILQVRVRNEALVL